MSKTGCCSDMYAQKKQIFTQKANKLKPYKEDKQSIVCLACSDNSHTHCLFSTFFGKRSLKILVT